MRLSSGHWALRFRGTTWLPLIPPRSRNGSTSVKDQSGCRALAQTERSKASSRFTLAGEIPSPNRARRTAAICLGLKAESCKSANPISSKRCSIAKSRLKSHLPPSRCGATSRRHRSSNSRTLQGMNPPATMALNSLSLAVPCACASALVAKVAFQLRTLPDGSVTLHSTLYRLPTALMYIPATRRSGGNRGGNLAETTPENARIPPDSFRQTFEA